MSTSYYDILGVPRTATEGDIKKAYKKLAMKYHPDKNAGDKASEAKFKQLNEAYQTLGDTQKKKNYDQFGSADAGGYSSGGSTYGSRGHTQGFDMGDIFSQFGGM
jgi:molecular chaperone DnaJ